MDVFEKPIEFLKGIGPGRARILDKELHIRTFRDLLFFFPYRYVDRSKFHLINDLNESNIIKSLKKSKGPSNMEIFNLFIYSSKGFQPPSLVELGLNSEATHIIEAEIFHKKIFTFEGLKCFGLPSQSLLLYHLYTFQLIKSPITFISL